MPWDPFLMKKLIKNEICGSVNSARMYCSRKTGQKLRLLFMYRTWTIAASGEKTREKKKKKEKEKRRNWNAANANPNTHWFKFETYLTNCTVHIHTRNHFSIMNESFQTNPSMMTMKHFNEFIFHNVNKHYLLII